MRRGLEANAAPSSPLSHLWQDGRELKVTHTLSFDRPGLEGFQFGDDGVSSACRGLAFGGSGQAGVCDLRLGLVSFNRNSECPANAVVLPAIRPETFRTVLLPLKPLPSCSSGAGFGAL